MLAEKFKLRRINKGHFNPMVNLVRYADDFIITCSDRETLESLIKPAVSEFLQARGLTLSEEKTKVTHIEVGFDFLGFNIRKYKGTLLIKPSKKNVKEFLAKIKGIIRKNQAIRQDKLIGLLNPFIQTVGVGITPPPPQGKELGLQQVFSVEERPGVDIRYDTEEQREDIPVHTEVSIRH